MLAAGPAVLHVRDNAHPGQLRDVQPGRPAPRPLAMHHVEDRLLGVAALRVAAALSIYIVHAIAAEFEVGILTHRTTPCSLSAIANLCARGNCPATTSRAAHKSANSPRCANSAHLSSAFALPRSSFSFDGSG